MSGRLKLCFACLLVFICLLWFNRSVFLTALGQYVVATTEDRHSVADFLVIPAADDIRPDVSTGTLTEAVRLLREGHVSHILMTCPDYYGVSECALAGHPDARIEWLRTERLADEDEADLAIKYLGLVKSFV